MLEDKILVINIIDRLRIATGKNFGYDADAAEQENEATITAWEQWFQSDGRIKFTPDAKLIGASLEPDLGR